MRYQTTVASVAIACIFQRVQMSRLSLLDTWSERRACPNIRVETKNYTQTSLQQA